MSATPLSSPVVVDGLLSDEKLAQLLALRTEYPELDYKRTLDLSAQPGRVELAKDVGAMQVRGGYIVVGVANDGTPTGELDATDMRPFDEANLAPRLLRFLPQPLELRTRVAEHDGHRIVLIYVGPHPAGCAFFQRDGGYTRGTEEVEVFRAGDVYWRDGTRSVRMSQPGLEAVIGRRIANAKATWLDEQREIRRRERDELEAAYEGRRLTEGPLGTVAMDLGPGELGIAALELLRRDDTIALIHLLQEATARARAVIEHNDIEDGLGDVLDKLACLAATFLQYEQREAFDRVVRTLTEIYSLPVGEQEAERFGYSSTISPQEVAPRVWLQVVERVFSLGALAVRRTDWAAVRALTLQHPDRIDDYNPNWLRHALTMASRASHLQQQQDGQVVQISLLSLARIVITRLDCLRPDLPQDDDGLLTSLAQFDLLSNIVAIAGAGSAEGRVFYSNFARFRQTRIQPVAERLLRDPGMREILFPLDDDDDLALALDTIGDRAQKEGWRYDGFDGWEQTPVGAFVAEHLPSQSAQ